MLVLTWKMLDSSWLASALLNKRNYTNYSGFSSCKLFVVNIKHGPKSIKEIEQRVKKLFGRTAPRAEFKVRLDPLVQQVFYSKLLDRTFSSFVDLIDVASPNSYYSFFCIPELLDLTNYSRPIKTKYL